MKKNLRMFFELQRLQNNEEAVKDLQLELANLQAKKLKWGVTKYRIKELETLLTNYASLKAAEEEE